MNQTKIKESIANVKPTFNKIVTTLNKIQVGNIILASQDNKDVDEIQTIVSVGPHVEENIKVGAKVKIDFTPYLRLKNNNAAVDKIKEEVLLLVPTITTPEGEFLLLSDRDVEFIIE